MALGQLSQWEIWLSWCPGRADAYAMCRALRKAYGLRPAGYVETIMARSTQPTTRWLDDEAPALMSPLLPHGEALQTGLLSNGQVAAVGKLQG
mmetsp:Transcript_1741/g.5483  ORF Transcript_1741/g.5483 Transcript_1741/m.5483 type:complete len:93 (-) Transcript_1741:1462-1740(-)